MGVPRREPTAEELADMHDPLVTDREFKARYGVGASTIQRWKAEYREAKPEPEPTIEEVLGDDYDDVEDLWRKAESYQYTELRTNRTKFEHQVTLKDRGPVLICWVADMHIGHRASDLRKIRQDLEAVRDTEGAYIIFGGDEGENTTASRGHHGAHHHRIMTTKTERRFIEQAYQMPGRDKVLAAYEGNHTARTITDDGVSFLQGICEKLGIYYGSYMGLLSITLPNKREYRILCAHRGRGGGMDKTRPAKKLLDDWYDADVVFTAHRHMPAISQEYIRLKSRVFAQAGTYKRFDEFGASLGFPPSSTDMPGVILYPDERRCDVLLNVFGSIEMFKREREHYLKATA